MTGKTEKQLQQLIDAYNQGNASSNATVLPITSTQSPHHNSNEHRNVV